MAHDSLGTRSVYSEGDAGNFTIGSDDSNVAITYWGFNGTYRFGSFVGATATNRATTATNRATTATNQNTGGGEAHNNLQPYIALNHIIKT
jgi:microcystin-dependent protein